MTTLNAAAKAAIAEALGGARHGERGAMVRRLAATYGVSASTIYRLAQVGGAKRPRAAQRPEYREWARIAVWIAHRAPAPMPLDLAVAAGVSDGVLPPEAAAAPVATLARIARTELGLAPARKRTHRLHAEYPMQAVQVDWSSSEHLVAERPEGEDWSLRLHRRPWSAGGYKNKPLKAHRMRVGVYALWDLCTGYTVARYAVERGESAFGAMEFVCWALALKDDPRLVLHGVPDDLWSDLGPFARSDAVRDLLERLDIALITGAPYAKERMGGVERSHRTRWSRLERALFLRERQTLRLSELNTRLVEFTVAENAQRPSRTRVGGRTVSRAAAWVALTNARPASNRLRALPPHPIETLARAARRKVDVNGLVRWGAVEYECADWHDRWVIARRAVDGSGDLTLEDEASGERRTARRYVPRPYGEVRTSTVAPLERLRETETGFTGADVYAPGEGDCAGAANVVALPARSAPAAALDNPLDADRLPDLDAALRLLHSIYPWPLSAANRARVIDRIEAAGLSRRAVTDLAQSLVALAGTG